MRARGSPKALNLYGKGWKAFDEAGMVHTEPYDFKGNLIEKNKQVISDSELLSVFSGPPPSWNVAPYIVDWTGLSTSKLDSQVFTTTMEYDALNRAMKVTYPMDVNGNRKELTPTYNRAGVLHKVSFDGTEYIKEIAYNAKGQPLLTAYGNSMMTRFVYDENTFRTVRLKTEKYAYTTPLGVHTYTPQGGTTKQDFAYEYDLIGNIMKLHDRTPDSGVSGTPDELDKLFDYDPLYRLIYAKGRESTNQKPNILWGDVLPTGTPNANNCQIYQQFYQYDKLGNIDQWNQSGNNSYTRKYVYASGLNRLIEINNGTSPSTPYSTFVYDNNGNMVSSDTDRKYIWDAADQLGAFYIQAGTSEPSIYAQYLYSGGSRSKKIVRTSGGDYEVTVYDGPFEYCKKVSGGTTYEKSYSHVEGAAEVRAGTAFPGDITDSIVYQLPDHLGSSNLRLDEKGALIDKEEYYPFGDTSLRTFTYKRYRYVGKEKDSESGLYYYGARYYASWTCRFISVDPLAPKYVHLTPYNYAGNKPVNHLDIDGMQSTGDQRGPGQNGNNSTTNVGTPTQNNAVPTASNNQIPSFINPYSRGNFATFNPSQSQSIQNVTPKAQNGSQTLPSIKPSTTALPQDGYIAQTSRVNTTPLSPINTGIEGYKPDEDVLSFLKLPKIEYTESDAELAPDEGQRGGWKVMVNAGIGLYNGFIEVIGTRPGITVNKAMEGTFNMLEGGINYFKGAFNGSTSHSYSGVEEMQRKEAGLSFAFSTSLVFMGRPFTPKYVPRNPNGNFYSVAFETKLPNNLYPGKGPYSHTKAANTALADAMTSDATFAGSMQELGIKVPISKSGTITGNKINNWVWHHSIEPGVMQLVPQAQHTSGSIFWGTLHPGGKGGMSIWGGGY